MGDTKVYENYISLGYFCSVAQELERIGLRSASFPFDWLITPEMSEVMRMIETHFDGFLEEDQLTACPDQPKIYVSSGTGFSFVHDLKPSDELPVADQLPQVKEKYGRRIERFYEAISRPTLFLRYISDERPVPGSDSDPGQPLISEDLKWIGDNLDHILEVIKSFNPDNDILWISNDTLSADVIPDIYRVSKDPEDTVARRPFEKNEQLGSLMESYASAYPGRDRNLEIYRQKEKRKNGLVSRLRNKISRMKGSRS